MLFALLAADMNEFTEMYSVPRSHHSCFQQSNSDIDAFAKYVTLEERRANAGQHRQNTGPMPIQLFIKTWLRMLVNSILHRIHRWWMLQTSEHVIYSPTDLNLLMCMPHVKNKWHAQIGDLHTSWCWQNKHNGTSTRQFFPGQKPLTMFSVWWNILISPQNQHRCVQHHYRC